MGLLTFWRKKDPIATVKRFGESLSNEGDLGPFLQYIQTDCPIIIDILRFHKRTAASLPQFYSALCQAGAGQTVRGYYVPASSLANPRAIDFICTILDRNDGWDRHSKLIYISGKLLEYVKTGHEPSGFDGLFFQTFLKDI
jgi:hypothetical protein